MGDLVKELEIFRGKRVLVTGHTGFKGSWLSMWLHHLGAEVTGYALPPENERDHFKLLQLDRLIKHIEADIRDFHRLKTVMDQVQPEFVFHLAAQSLVRLSYENPKMTFDTNVGGSVNVLEAVRCSPSVRSLIYVTTDKCYWNNEWVWGYRENDRLGGRDPYSASKAAAEMVFTAYLESYIKSRPDFGAASVRAGNVIGGGDWARDRIVPDCVTSLMEGRPISIRNPSATRPWQHVLEPLFGYLLLAARLYSEPARYSGPWNFGPRGESIRNVDQLARGIIELWGDGYIEYNMDSEAPHEANILQLNCDKAHHLLGWHPCWDFSTTLQHTVEWYRGLQCDEPAQRLTLDQIELYTRNQQLI